MKKYTEFTGRTVEEAIEEGLAALSLTREQAEIVVLEEGKKGLFKSVIQQGAGGDRSQKRS